MLMLLECFIIKFTIPKLLNKDLLKQHLTETEFSGLLTLTKMNRKLVSGVIKDDSEITIIQNYFIKRLRNTIPSHGNYVKTLPSSLNPYKVFSLKSLTARYLRKNPKILTRDKFKKLPEELKEKFNQPKQIKVFGRLGAKEASELMYKLVTLVELEKNKKKLNTIQVLQALTIALYCEEPSLIQLFMSKVDKLKKHSKELLEVMILAIKLQQNDVFFSLLKMKSDFILSDHINQLLNCAVLNANIDMVNFLTKTDNSDVLWKKGFLLHAAVKSGNNTLIDKMLELKFDPKQRNDKGLLPIHYALGKLEIFERLLFLVKDALNEADHLNLFRKAALSGKLNLIVDNNIFVNNSDKKLVLKEVFDQFSKSFDDETQYWGEVFSPFNRTFKVILALLDFKIDLHEVRDFELHKEMLKKFENNNAISNSQLKNNLSTLIDHPKINRDISCYQHYIKNNTARDRFVITLLFFYNLTALSIASTGVGQKIYPELTNCQTDHEKTSCKNSDTFILAGCIFLLLNFVIIPTLFCTRNIASRFNFFAKKPSQPDIENGQPDLVISSPSTQL